MGIKKKCSPYRHHQRTTERATDGAASGDRESHEKISRPILSKPHELQISGLHDRSSSASAFVRRCQAATPEDRPSAGLAMVDPWFDPGEGMAPEDGWARSDFLYPSDEDERARCETFYPEDEHE